MNDEANAAKVTAVDYLTLRFDGTNKNGGALHELRAAHVAEVLQGVVGLTSDFEKAGVFHDEGPIGSEILVRPAKEGSFLIEVVRTVVENWDTVKATGETVAATATAAGVPTLSTVVWWATKSLRADVKDFSYLDNGNVKVVWQDETAEEIPLAAWKELQKHKKRRKRHLRQIMAPLADTRVTELDVAAPAQPEQPDAVEPAPRKFALTRVDYDAAKPEDEIQEKSDVFDIEARMSTIDFDDSARWRVTTQGRTRTVTVEDQKFLRQVAQGLAIHPKDVFSISIREDKVVKNGRTQTKWFAESVARLRRAAVDDESSPEPGPPAS